MFTQRLGPLVMATLTLADLMAGTAAAQSNLSKAR